MGWYTENKTWIIPYESKSTLAAQTLHRDDAETIIVEEGFLTISEGCFSYYEALKYLRLPDSVTSLGNNILCYSSSIIEVNIPLNCRELSSDQPFDYQYTLERFIINENHKYFCVFEDSLYSKDMSVLYYFPGGKKDKIFSIPQGVKTIALAALAHNMNLEILILPPSISKIMPHFCYFLEKIRHVIIIRCESSVEIDFSLNNIFAGTPYSYERIEWKDHSYYYDFVNNSHLSVFMNNFCPNNSPVVFNDSYFSNNSFIKSISFNRGIQSIEGPCFKDNKKLTRISFSETISRIDKSSFSNCNSLKRYSSIFYPQSILPILKPIFNSYILGLSLITCHKPFRQFSFLSSFIIFIL